MPDSRWEWVFPVMPEVSWSWDEPDEDEILPLKLAVYERRHYFLVNNVQIYDFKGYREG